MKALSSSVLLCLSLLALASAAPSPQQFYPPRPAPFTMAQASPQRTAYGAMHKGIASLLPSPGRPTCDLDPAIVSRGLLIAASVAAVGPYGENCGRKVRLSYQGRTVDAYVAASCGFCSENGILIWPNTAKALVPDGRTGMLNGITWAFVGNPNDMAAANAGGIGDREGAQQRSGQQKGRAPGSTTTLRRPYLNIPGSALGTAPDSLSISTNSPREKGKPTSAQRQTQESAFNDDYYP